MIPVINGNRYKNEFGTGVAEYSRYKYNNEIFDNHGKKKEIIMNIAPIKQYNLKSRIFLLFILIIEFIVFNH